MQAIPTLDGILKFKENETTELTVKIELPPLIPGEYFLSFWAGSHNTETLDFKENILGFRIIESPTKGRTVPHTEDHGYIVPYSKLEIKNGA